MMVGTGESVYSGGRSYKSGKSAGCARLQRHEAMRWARRRSSLCARHWGYDQRCCPVRHARGGGTKSRAARRAAARVMLGPRLFELRSSVAARFPHHPLSKSWCGLTTTRRQLGASSVSLFGCAKSRERTGRAVCTQSIPPGAKGVSGT